MDERIQNVLGIGLLLCSFVGTGVYVNDRIGNGALRSRGSESAVRAVTYARALAANGHREGAAAPRVTMVVFEDYQCPGCRLLQQAIDSALASDSLWFAVVYRHYPLTSIHEAAEGAARASVCAGGQGRFAQFHRLAFRESELVAAKRWGELASRAGVEDTSTFNACLRNGHADAALTRDRRDGDGLALIGTPSYVIGDSLYTGARSPAALRALLVRSTTQP